jgi:TolB-like protein
MKRIISIIGLGGIVLLGGCTILKKPAPQPQVQFYIDKTHDFSAIGKIAVLELEDESVSSPELAKTLTQNLADTLGKKQLFSIRTVYRSDPEWKSCNLDQVNILSSQDMEHIAKQLKVDAILVGTITRYRPYPQLLTAMRFKMVDLRSGRLLWAMENVWDSTDKNAEQRIQSFFKTQMRTGYQPMNWQFVTNSPSAFQKFVMYEVVSTLPESRMK